MTNATCKPESTSTDEDYDENREMERLEQEIANTKVVLRQNEEALEKKRKDVKELHRTLDVLNEKSVQLWDTFNQKIEDRTSLQEESDRRMQKLNDANEQIDSLKMTIERGNVEESEKNLELEFLKEANKSALEKLERLSSHFEEVSPAIEEYLT